MVLYVHVMLFFICLNFGLGITTIPDTPLFIEKYQRDENNNLMATTECFHSFQSQSLIVPIYFPISATHPDDNSLGVAGVSDGIANDYVSGWTSTMNPDGSSLSQFIDMGTGSGLSLIHI